MSTSHPLTPHPQEAATSHAAGSGPIGAQPAAPARHAEHGLRHLIDQGYSPARQLSGKVVGIWGDAHIRLLTGEVKPLHVGDVVKKGEVV
ncbi:MAG: hypothetical protein ABW032_01875 [Burkholderiaceae bacterium]